MLLGRSRIWILAPVFCFLACALTGSEGAAAWMARGTAAEEARFRADALRSYAAAATWIPRSPIPPLRQGKVYAAQGRYEEAERAIWRAHLLSPQFVPALMAMGDLASARGLPAQAVEWYWKARQVQPNSTSILYALGNAYWEGGELGAAEESFREVVAMAPDLREAHLLLGALLARSDLQQARTHLRAAGPAQQDEIGRRAFRLLQDLERVEALSEPGQRSSLLGLTYIYQKMWPLAEGLLETAARQLPNNGEILTYLGYTQLEMGQIATALETLKNAVAIDPSNVQSHHFLAMAYQHLGWQHEALASLAQAYGLDSSSPAIAAEIGQAYADVGAYDQAEDWFAEATRLAPGSADYVLLQASFHVNHVYHVRAKGLPAAEQGVAIAPEDPVAHDLLGWGLHLIGEHTRALASVQTALELDPYLTSAHYHLAEIQWSLGHASAARVSWKRVLDLSASRDWRARALERLAETSE